jgi:antitoxin component YwqK of YwqJK toxin-antitoxin module/PP-loop superfamily ATP-utilizing enzyme
VAKTYDNGKIRYTGTFKNDIPVGTFTYFFEKEGGKMSEITYRGESGIGYAVAYHTTGIKQAEGLYNKQLKDSVWTYYSRKGILTQRESYTMGQLNGPRITYWENAKVAEIVDFKDGEENGRWVRKWDNGTLRTKGTYKGGMLEDECIYYDENAKMIAKVITTKVKNTVLGIISKTTELFPKKFTDTAHWKVKPATQMNKPKNETTVVVGLSGGVDSSVTAYLLKEQGYRVIGLFMRNWVDESVTIHDECPWVEDSNDAMQVADKLGIPFQVIDMSASYQERIVDYMFSEYERGRTPNPDVLCNREIKFDLFLKTALSLGADFVATGHYVRKSTTVNDEGIATHHLLSGLDPGKDQSYFLCQLSQEQLSKALFPIGHLQKSEVREIAREADLVTAEKERLTRVVLYREGTLTRFLATKIGAETGYSLGNTSRRADVG